MSIVNVEALKQNNCVLYWPGAVASSNSPKAITSAGDCKQILPFPGAGIGMFDGTGDYIQVNSTAVGSNNFSVMGYVKFNAYPDTSGCHLFNTGYNTGTSYVFGGVYYSSTYKWFLITHPEQNVVYSSTTFITNTWYFVQLIRIGTSFNVYIDGNLALSTTTPSIYSYAGDVNYYIGWAPPRNLSTAYFNGHVSEVKCTFDTSVIPPPKYQLSNDINTLFLIHFNRNDTTFIDSSPSAHTITRYGDAKQLCSPCGSGVAAFDGGGDYLSVPYSSDIALTGVFTMGFWLYYIYSDMETLDPAWCTILQNGAYGSGLTFQMCVNTPSTQQRIMAILTPTNVAGRYYSVYTPVISGSIKNKWVYVEFVSTGTQVGISIDGQFGSWISYSGSYTPTNILKIGQHIQSGTHYLNGYISDFIFLDGIALHTANFTPSTTPSAPDPYTKLLLHMDGVGNAFYDSSDPPNDNGFPILPDGVTVTPNGTFTVQKMKDGRNVWVFDGSTNYITISDHASWSMFLNDFTIAGWVKFDSIAANRTIIGQYADANNQWFVRWATSNVIQLYGITSSTAQFNFSCPLTAVANTWYHVVVERSGSSCIMYINGVAQTVTQTTAFSATATNIAAVLSIGKINTEYQAGNTKDLQIFTKALTMDQVSALYQETYIY